MSPEHARSFGGGVGETMMNPFVLIAMILAIVLIFVLPRKYLVVPFFLMIFLVPLDEQIVVGGIHFFVSRIMILASLPRMFLSGSKPQETSAGDSLKEVSKIFFWCIVCQAAAVVLLFHSGEAVINQAGFLLDYLGGFFLVQFLIQDEEDIVRALKCLAFISVVIAIGMVREQFTMQNIFGYIGGSLVPDMREGRVRSAGPFVHALMAGAFGATMVPLFIGLWMKGQGKVIALAGVLGGLLITWASNSSTSLMTILAGFCAICFWPMRQKMRTVRWAIGLGLLALHLIMKAPVWFIITHIDLTGGNSNYHRAVLIDAFIRHFSDWVLIGVKDTGTWGWDLWDAQNQYVNIGETGGLLALILFITLISRCFANLGTARKAIEGDKRQEWFLWLVGSALFANTIAFLGVNYFDNMKFAWFALIAIIGAATAPLLAPKESLERTVTGRLGQPALTRLWVSPSSPKRLLTNRAKETLRRPAHAAERVPLKRLPS